VKFATEHEIKPGKQRGGDDEAAGEDGPENRLDAAAFVVGMRRGEAQAIGKVIAEQYHQRTGKREEHAQDAGAFGNGTTLGGGPESGGFGGGTRQHGQRGKDADGENFSRIGAFERAFDEGEDLFVQKFASA
jgi:hypothetical protein